MRILSLILSMMGIILFYLLPVTDGYSFIFKKWIGYIVGIVLSLTFSILSLWFSAVDFKRKKYIKTKASYIIYFLTWFFSITTISLFLYSLI